MTALLFVGVGGFIGAIARYILGNWVTQRVLAWTGWNVPAGTLFVNFTGSMLLAVFGVWLTRHLDMPVPMRLLIGTGFFGAFTTFSTFANETIALYTQRGWRAALLYVAVMNGVCLLGVVVGLLAARRVWIST